MSRTHHVMRRVRAALPVERQFLREGVAFAELFPFSGPLGWVRRLRRIDRRALTRTMRVRQRQAARAEIRSQLVEGV